MRKLARVVGAAGIAGFLIALALGAYAFTNATTSTSRRPATAARRSTATT